MTDFSYHRFPIGRKDYKCDWCEETIPKGEKHCHFTGVWEGEWQNWRMHDECFAASGEERSEGFFPYDHERPKKEIAACQKKNSDEKENEG